MKWFKVGEYFKELTSSLNIYNIFNISFYCDNDEEYQTYCS